MHQDHVWCSAEVVDDEVAVWMCRDIRKVHGWSLIRVLIFAFETDCPPEFARPVKYEDLLADVVWMLILPYGLYRLALLGARRPGKSTDTFRWERGVHGL